MKNDQSLSFKGMPKIWYKNLNQAMISNLTPYIDHLFQGQFF